MHCIRDIKLKTGVKITPLENYTVMKCINIFSVTLLSTLVFMAGCKPEEKNADTNKTKAAVKKTADANPANIKPEEPKDPNEVVATVNGKKYLRKDLDTMVNAIIKARNVPAAQVAMAKAHFEKQAVYSFIMKTMLMDEAKKAGIKVSEEDRKKEIAKVEKQLKAQNKTIDQYFKESPVGEKRARKEFADSIMIDKLLNTKVIDKIKITDADAQKQIEEIKKANKEIEEKNKNLEAVNADKKKKIEDLKKQLDNGADFAELAKANSDCPSGQKGGDLGTFGRGQMVPEFEKAAFSQEVGKVGDIVQTQFGYHLIKVTAKSPAVKAKGDTPAKPETVTASHILIKCEKAGKPQPIPSIEDVKKNLKQQQSRTEVQTYISGLKSNAVIETVFKDLPL